LTPGRIVLLLAAAIALVSLARLIGPPPITKPAHFKLQLPL
jgi:hypothetical protein